jgi:tRNA nucleotidyltransferase/poly(A) polymerase
MQIKLTATQAELVQLIRDSGHKVWLVGGAVRDLLLEQEPKDLDFCTNLEPTALALMIPGHGFIALPDKTALSHGIVRVVDKETGKIIDIAALRKDVSCDGRHAQVELSNDIIEDLSRRDFTINAMAAEISPDGTLGEIIDPFGGRDDLKEKLVRFVGNPLDRIQEDALRMIRACRFTALDENWNCLGKLSISESKEQIRKVSKERIRDEIMKALMYKKPSNFFRHLEMCGLLAIIFPDLHKGVGITQNEHHAEPVFDHLMRTVDVSVQMTDNPLLRLAALTHDLAKPHTRTEDERGIHFYKHEVAGASLVYNWMKEYKFSRAEIEYVSKLVRHHQWRFEDATKPKTIRHWLQDVGRDLWKDLITLRSCDRGGNLKKMQAGKGLVTKKMRELISTVEEMIASGVPLFKEDLAINGDDLIQLGMKPGPAFKEVFSNLIGLVVNDPEKNTKEWLSDYIRRNYVQKAINKAAENNKSNPSS